MWPSPGGAKSAPYGIAITPDGMVWYSESGVKPNTIIQFNPTTEQFARAMIPSGGGTVRNMAATADGRVYIACNGGNKVGLVERARFAALPCCTSLVACGVRWKPRPLKPKEHLFSQARA